jgi:polysaccharide deacetylase family protein (PEP-CTERM system associated)
MEALVQTPNPAVRSLRPLASEVVRVRREPVAFPFSPPPPAPLPSGGRRVILSFDVEEHFRIEAAAGIRVDPGLKACYHTRLESSTRWLLGQLGKCGVRATFFVLGKIARDHPDLVRAIHRDGHEVGSHGWGHERVHRLSPAQFRRDVRWSKDALEQVTGEAVLGYRAPTFSIMRQTAWALDVLVEQGLRYDSSIYPVWHDRYGVPDAPRTPFLARGACHTILELPLATLRLLGMNVPVGGGGYFRLLPRFLMEAALQERVGGQGHRRAATAVTMLYFHPWEFDPLQPRLPLRRLSRWRTYWGIFRSRGRFRSLLAGHRFVRAVDVLGELQEREHALATFALADQGQGGPPCSPRLARNGASGHGGAAGAAVPCPVGTGSGGG